METLDEKYNYWNRTWNSNTEEDKKEDTNMHHIKNPKTWCSITNMYPNIEECESYIKDWID